jgi:hypothetical protein
MAQGIKECATCGGLYTGSAERCLGCIFRSLPPAVSSSPKTRAERRAVARAKQAHQQQAAQVERNASERSQCRQPSPQSNTLAKPQPAGQAHAPKTLPNLRKRSPSKRVDTNLPGKTQVVGSVPIPPPEPGLGAQARSEGSVRAEVGMHGRVLKKATVQCSCLGNNQSCFKCDGTGYCEVELAPEALLDRVDTLRARTREAQPEVHFSGDPRGGEPYGIRERGRFGSNPLHDDHNE